MLTHLLSTKYLILSIYGFSVAYTQLRGKVRLRLTQQLVNHSTLMAPINVLMYLFSSIPNQPFIDLQHFPELEKLRENWKIIREEANTLVKQGYIKASNDNTDLGFNSFFKRGWKRFYLKWYAEQPPSAQALCPNTVNLLNNIPSVKSAMFTLLPKQGQLKAHRDPYAGSLRYHLGLITPNSEQCRIYVDGLPYAWKDGEGVLFDETYIHSAKNDTDIDRIILFCDIERPLRNKFIRAFNRFFARYFVSAAATKNMETDRVGFLNKAYQHYHQIVKLTHRLKKTNKFLYRVFQYTLFIGLFIFIFI
ncbi:MAG: aspartyl/asparaginyl beta-hydroxylase domain-containing protein [Gammaproteobacteria bacterium]|nr:aspartyl/asparaginyl beta-hydroxylase domain-containing protein [Gammaproteobacteria bacterium]